MLILGFILGEVKKKSPGVAVVEKSWKNVSRVAWMAKERDNAKELKDIVAEILTVLFVGSEFWQSGFTQCFFMGTEYFKTLGCRGSRGH